MNGTSVMNENKKPINQKELERQKNIIKLHKTTVIAGLLYALTFIFLSFNNFISEESNDYLIVTINLLFCLFAGGISLNDRKKNKKTTSNRVSEMNFTLAFIPVAISSVDAIKRILKLDNVAMFIDLHPKGWIATGCVILIFIVLLGAIAYANKLLMDAEKINIKDMPRNSSGS